MYTKCLLNSIEAYFDCLIELNPMGSLPTIRQMFARTLVMQFDIIITVSFELPI